MNPFDKEQTHSMKILLVEDDPEQLEPISAVLSKAGYLVDGAGDGDTAQWLMFQKDYDLLILDWMLPQVSGLSLCQQYRQAGKTTPVLMLTAKDTAVDKVTGLDSGADDYLIKPFEMIELLARVRALSRRSPLWQGNTLSVADLKLEPTTLTVERGQTSVQISAREFQLLEYFVRHPNQILTREQIEQYLWEWDAEPESNAVTAAVRRLRQRLRSVNAADWIETVYGMGYRLSPQNNP